MQEEARWGDSGDVEVVVALARRAVAELSGNRGGDVWARREAHAEPMDRAITDAVDGDPTRCLAVGTIDGIVVGYALMRAERLNDASLLATITDLYVEPEARHVGVGEALMALLEERAREFGAVGLDAIVLPGDRDSKNFFEGLGLKARAILVHRSLIAGAGGTSS